MKPPVYDPDWSDEVKALHKHDMEEIWDPQLAPHLWNQYHNLLDVYSRLVDGESLDVLDIGCAQGTLALTLGEKGHRVTAVDIRQQFLDYAKTRHTHGDVTFVCSDALQLDLQGAFDIVFANQIIEHLVYPVSFVAKLKEWVKPGGRLIMTTPNGHYLRSNLPSYTELGDPSRWEHLQYTADGDGHFFAYRIGELDEILDLAGFDKRRVSWFETPLVSGHMKMRYLHNYVPLRHLTALDRVLQRVPFIGKRFAHQLMAIAIRER